MQIWMYNERNSLTSWHAVKISQMSQMVEKNYLKMFEMYLFIIDTINGPQTFSAFSFFCFTIKLHKPVLVS